MFINLDFEMRFDNFTCTTCILYIELVENLKLNLNLDFEMRFDNFTRATCILYIDLVETLKFLPSECTKYKLHV